MANAALTPEQEAVAHKIDTAGLAMLGAGVLGGVMQHHGAPGGTVQRIGKSLHTAGPYLDLAGLALIAPPIMHPLARALAPAAPKPPEAPKLPGELGVPSQEALDAADTLAAVSDAPDPAAPSDPPLLEPGHTYGVPRPHEEHLKAASCLGELAVRIRYLDTP